MKIEGKQNDDADVIIIGAGIVGICCALSIMDTGLKVHLIDRAEPGQATSFGNAGVISPASIIPNAMPGIAPQIPSMLLKDDGPLSIRLGYFFQFIPWGLRFLMQARPGKVRHCAQMMHALNYANVDLYRKLLSGTGHEHLLVDSFYIHAYRKAQKASLDNLANRIQRDFGAELDLISGDALRKIEPALSPDFEAAIIIKGQARVLSPGKIGKVLFEKALAKGARFSQTRVLALDKMNDEDWAVETEMGRYLAKKLVLSAGAWSRELLRPLGINVPLEAERGYHLEFSNPGVHLNNSVMDVDMKTVASSMEKGLRFAGTAEFAGLDQPPTQARLNALLRQVTKALPEINVNDRTSWMGNRPTFPDSLPVIDEVKRLKGLVVAFGHSHWGLMMAPKTGEIVSQLVNEKAPNDDISPCRLDRF